MGPGFDGRMMTPQWHGYAQVGFEHHHDGHPLAWVIFALLLVVLLLLIVALVLGLTRRRGRGPFGPVWTWRAPPPGAPGPPHLEEPLSVLRLRYARGEISRDEFLQASTDLGGPAAEPPPG